MSDDKWEKTIGLADLHGTVARINYDPPEDESDAYASFTLSCGSASMHCSPTPEAMRQLAAALLDAAEQTDRAVA